MSEPFDPTKHITKLKGIDYLEVKWRLAWLRDRHPDAVIETELIAHDDKLAIFKATVSLPGPAGSASGFGSETPGDFRDYIEKAETKAIGRALAALGFGTQFAGYEDGASNDRPVDAPVKREASPRNAGATQTNATAKQAQERALIETISQGQINVILKHQKDLGWSNDDMKLIVAAHDYTTIKDFSAEQGMRLIKVMSDPATADPYISLLRKPAQQVEMIPNVNAAERARN